LNFFCSIDTTRPGPGGFASHINQIRPLGHQILSMVYCVRNVLKLATIGKGIWGNIQHPHDRNPIKSQKSAGAIELHRLV
jgi:hypothetical protein